MWRNLHRWADLLSLIVLILSIGVTLFAVDTHAQKPFRDPKESLLLYSGGLAGLLFAVRLLTHTTTRRSLYWLSPLSPVLALAGWRFVESLGGMGAFEAGL